MIDRDYKSSIREMLDRQREATEQAIRDVVTDLCDALVQPGDSPSMRYCVACDFMWHIDVSSTANVHGEKCVVMRARRAVEDIADQLRQIATAERALADDVALVEEGEEQRT